MTVHVTDHALVRYLERRCKIDMDAVREQIKREVQCAVIMGATYFHEGDSTFVFDKTKRGEYSVTTVLDRGAAINRRSINK